MWNLCYSFSYCLIGHFCVSLGQYFKYLGKLFSAILYAYYGVCSILVPWSTMCYASEIGRNLFRHYFDSTVTNTLKLRVNSSELCFVHIGICDTTRNSIFIGWNMCYSQFNILSHVPAEIWLPHMVQNEFGYSDLIFWFSSKNESRWYIDVCILCHSCQTQI